jgi:hypothetical protein
MNASHKSPILRNFRNDAAASGSRTCMVASPALCVCVHVCIARAAGGVSRRHACTSATANSQCRRVIPRLTDGLAIHAATTHRLHSVTRAVGAHRHAGCRRGARDGTKARKALTRKVPIHTHVIVRRTCNSQHLQPAARAAVVAAVRAAQACVSRQQIFSITKGKACCKRLQKAGDASEFASQCKRMRWLCCHFKRPIRGSNPWPPDN